MAVEIGQALIREFLLRNGERSFEFVNSRNVKQVLEFFFRVPY